jgi:hypothetical protein
VSEVPLDTTESELMEQGHIHGLFDPCLCDEAVRLVIPCRALTDEARWLFWIFCMFHLDRNGRY